MKTSPQMVRVCEDVCTVHVYIHIYVCVCVNPTYPGRASRVTSLLVCGDFLYIGTRGGVILTVDLPTMTLHKLLHAYTRPVRSLLLIQSDSDSPSVLRRLFSRKDSSNPRLTSNRSSDSLTTSISDQPFSSRAILVSMGMAYRGVVGDATNHAPVFILPSDGTKTHNKLVRTSSHYGHLLMWSADTSRTSLTNQTTECGMEGDNLPDLCEADELSDELFENGD